MDNFDVKYRLEGMNQSIHANKDNEHLSIKIESDDKHLRITLTAKSKLTLLQGKLSAVRKMHSEDIFLTNGYQSWTDTKERTMHDHERNVMRLPKSIVQTHALDKYGDAIFYPYKPNILHGYDLFYIKGKEEYFSFNRNHKTAYLIYEVDTKAKILSILSDVSGLEMEQGESIVLFDFYFSSSIEEGLSAFRKAFTPRDAKKLFGYTSWYNYYQDIAEPIMLRDLAALDSRFELFQIDDGYETFVGDWLDVDPKKFPNGLEPIVKKVHERGFKAGLWLAPFAAEEKSLVYKDHPDWFVKDDDGNPLRSGDNWSGFYCFDLSNDGARAYIKRCLQHYVDMGIDFFKLDFLYAIAIKPLKGKSRAQMTDYAYGFLRECLGDKLILGCGANVFSSHGHFDYLRIGPDVSLIFDDVWYMKYMHRERISTKVTLQNTIYRSIFDACLFRNDPDVFLLRKENIKMSDEQKESLLTINALFGSLLMTSDNISTYDEPTKAMLEDKLRLFREAKDIDFANKGKFISISYSLGTSKKHLVYNTKKGTLKVD